MQWTVLSVWKFSLSYWSTDSVVLVSKQMNLCGFAWIALADHQQSTTVRLGNDR